MKKLDYPNKKTCGECAWFFLCGNDPKDGTCGKPLGGRNYCIEDDEACEDYEDPDDHTIDKELRMLLPSAKRVGEDTAFSYVKDTDNGMRECVKVKKHSFRPFVYAPDGKLYVDGSLDGRHARVGITWMLTEQELRQGEGVTREAKERVLQAIVIRLFVDDYEMGSPIHICVEDCEKGKKVIGSVIINNYVQER